MLTSFYLGWLAYTSGMSLEDSPYGYCTAKDIDWVEGWQNAYQNDPANGGPYITNDEYRVIWSGWLVWD